MKRIIRVFGGYKQFMGTVTQIIITVILLPALCFILNLLVPGKASDFFLGIIGEADLFEVWFEMAARIFQSQNVPDMLTYLNEIVNALNSVIFEATILGLCIFACRTVGEMLNIIGIPLLQTVIGSFLGCIVIGATEADGTGLYLSLAITFLTLLNIVLFMYAAEGNVLSKLLKFFPHIGMSAIIAGLASAFVVVNILIMQGAVPDLLTAVQLLLVTAFPLLLFATIDYLYF